MRVPTDRSLASWIRELIDEDRLYRFYKTREFRDLRARIFEQQHHECMDCSERGEYSRAVLLHHDQEVREHPELALSEFYHDRDGRIRRNLWPLCFNCHEIRHDRAYRGKDNRDRDREREIEERFPERW